MSALPRVAIAILAKQKEVTLPLFLHALSALDYPKDRISLLVVTNNNTDRTETVLLDWLAHNSGHYERVEFRGFDAEQRVERFDNHEWNAERFLLLGRLRQETVRRAMELKVDYYLVVDCDNYLAPKALRTMIDRKVPVVGPLLHRVCPPGQSDRYSNFHSEVDEQGYLRETPRYDEILNRVTPGLHEVAVIHCCYLIDQETLPHVAYLDGTPRHEYVVFSAQLRERGIPQYIDNSDVLGYLTLVGKTVDEVALMPQAWRLWRELAYAGS